MGLRLTLVGVLVAGALALTTATSARAATKYQCGEGRPSLDAKRCVCPKGQDEATDRDGVSRCVPSRRSAPVASTASPSTSASTPSAATCPPDAKLVAGVCVRQTSCPPGARWIVDHCEAEAVCPPGARAQGGRCVGQVECPDGAAATPDGKCAPAPAPGAPSASAPSTAPSASGGKGGDPRCPPGMASIGGAHGSTTALFGVGLAVAAALAAARRRRGALFALGLAACDHGPTPRTPQAPVSSFCLDRNEVTVEAYAACVSSGVCTRPDGYDDSLRSTKHQCNWDREEHERHPINCVDWEQAAAYCGFRGARLPTADEWQWAARGGARNGNYPWGSGEPQGRACFGRRDGTCPAGSFDRGASPDGVQDLAGNVAEWVSDVDSDEWTRRIQGGSWFDVDGVELRADAVRTKAGRYRSFSVGFRCATGAR